MPFRLSKVKSDPKVYRYNAVWVLGSCLLFVGLNWYWWSSGVLMAHHLAKIGVGDSCSAFKVSLSVRVWLI